MVIMHNMTAENAARQVSTGKKRIEKSTERLSSGYHINRSADDAAGLTISEKMRWQIRGLDRAADNAGDGVSYIRTAEGALGEMHSLMERCKELCVQAANDTNTEADRRAIQEEVDQLTQEIDRISATTQYNTLHVFSTDGISPFDMLSAGGLSQTITVTMDFIDKDGNVLTPDSGAETNTTNYTGDSAVIAAYAAEQAALAANAIMKAYPALKSASSPGIKVGLNLANIDGANNTLASAQLSISWSSAETVMTYTMNVDTSDYNINNYNDGELAATIAHEMTHLIMQDTLTAGMLGQNSEGYPKWFKEGMAQTASGDSGWFSYSLNSSSTDADIKAYLSQTASMPYGAGYLSTLYLGQLASGQGTVSTGSLRSGINTILSKLIAGNTLSQVIRDISGGAYTSYKDFEKNVAKDAGAIQFTKDFIAARGKDGAGSVVASNLSVKEEDVLNGNVKYTASYVIDTGTTAYKNHYGSGFTFPDLGTTSGTGGGGTGTVVTGGGGMLYLQVGALGGQYVALNTYDASSEALYKGRSIDVMSFEKATSSIAIADEAIDGISAIRSYYGAVENRLEKTISNLENTEENTQAAESKIRDTDMAEEMVTYSSANIVVQAAQSMLAQANQDREGVLQLLQA